MCTPSSTPIAPKGHPAFSEEETHIIVSHEKSSSAKLISRISGDKNTFIARQMLVWNINDGPAAERKSIASKVLQGFCSHLMLFQEFSWKVHKYPGQCDFVLKSCRKHLRLPDRYKSVYYKTVNMYLVTMFDHFMFEYVALPPQAKNLMEQLFPLMDNRNRVCVCLLRDKISGKQFYVVNIHAPRGDEMFCRNVLNLLPSLYRTSHNGTRFASGVVYAGDFNAEILDHQIPKYVALLSTENDPQRENRTIDYFGHVDGFADMNDIRANVIVSTGRLLNWREHAQELFDATPVGAAAKTLNHAILVASVKFFSDKETREKEFSSVVTRLDF